MKKIMKKVLVAGACVALAAGCLGLTACGGSNSTPAPAGNDYKLVEDGKLTIGSDLDYPPMTMMDDQGNPDGFESAMMQEVCNRIGLEMNYLPPQNFDSLMTQVGAGTTMDVAVSAITINDERKEVADFTDSYYDSNLAVVAKKGAVKDKKDLNDPSVTVSAQSGTSGEAWAKENLPKAKLVSYTTITDCVTAVVSDKAMAAVYDAPIAETHVANQFAQCEIVDVIATGEQYGIVVNKENTKLTEDINAALKAMQEDGTMEKLVAEYLG